MGHDVVRDYAAARKALGVVPQELVFDPFFSVRETLRIQSGYFGVRDNDAWIDELLSALGLADKGESNMRQLSGGMKRRVLVAQALVHRPPVIVLDEPTAGVDPQSRERIYDVLAELAASGVSLLLTTHHLEEAEARCERTVIIDYGRVIASGTLAQLVDETVGRHRLVTLRVSDPLPDATAGDALEVDAADPRIIRTRMDDVAAELPLLLETVRRAGPSVEDVDVRGPSLQAVFIHLTGRELRE
jgi:ABC-2 type transport system ATP-binding protein